jgi:DNA-directed RNA polymerase specialized sigma24 family protein
MDAAADTEFGDFMSARWPGLVRLGYGLTGDPQAAEDLAQTALARAYASWRGSAGPTRFTCAGPANANRTRFRSRRVAQQLTATARSRRRTRPARDDRRP